MGIITRLANDVSQAVSAVENLADYVSEQVSEYFFKPSDDLGIGGVKLDLIGEQVLKFGSDVTDHYVESNVSYQDQISLPPITYTIRGEVGELVYYQLDSKQTNIGYVEQRLTPIAAFAPVVSDRFSQISQKALEIAGWVDSADNIITRLSKMGFTKKNENGENESGIYTQQEIAYMQLIALRNQRQPINVTTPWTNLSNYVITDVTLTQPARTRDKTQISISLKEFRATDLRMTKFNANNYQGRAGSQRSLPVEQGQTTGLESTLFVGAGRKTFSQLTGS